MSAVDLPTFRTRPDGSALWMFPHGGWKTCHLFRDGVTPHTTLCGRQVRLSGLSEADWRMPRCGQCATRRASNDGSPS